MHMLVFVLDDPNRLDEVLDAWDQVGVSGVTVIESTGLSRIRQAKLAGQAFMAGINRMIQADQEGHYTLFTVVKGEQKVRECLAAAEKIMGDLREPGTGIIASWPVSIVKGVPDPSLDTER